MGIKLTALRSLNALGLRPLQFAPLRKSRAAARYLRDAVAYRRAEDGALPLTVADAWPMLEDFDACAGSASGHYYHMDLWAARKIFERRPDYHVDIGSRIDGFVAHLLVFMPVTVVDIRPLASDDPRLQFVQSDAMILSRFPADSLDSVSSLHAVEHFGLGRYGDPVNPRACYTAMRALARVLRPGGRLYFAVPVGRERVEFNAHRVFNPRTILKSFDDLRLVSFAAVRDNGTFDAEADPAAYASAQYSCGLFEFTKP